ncbi:MAG: DNA primase [Pirellulaceae bacterium]|nr:DNA primase [Pirellulaceae bacterium]
MSVESDMFDAKEQVRQAIGIVDLVRSYIELRPKGRIFVGHCPWHNDSNPSLQVNPERQSWRCWVCDLGGDIFSFVMQREQVGFREALEILADRAGVVLRKSSREERAEEGSPRHRPTLYRALGWAEEQFHRCLCQSEAAEPAREYLRQRGINEQSIAEFRLGFSPSGWQWLLDRSRGTGFSPEVLEAVGLLGRSQNGGRMYDRFRERLIFPIRDPLRRCVAFGGRIVPGLSEGQPAKYINSPETRLFTKSEHLYGLDLARDEVARQRELVIVEGYTDVVMAHQVGVKNVAAVLGTALNERHIANVRRFTDRVALVLDGDEAGRTKANAILELFVAADMDLRIVTLPDNLDPFDFFLREGADAFRTQLRSAADALDHKLDVVTQGIDLLRDTHRATAALEDVLRTLALAPDEPATKLREEQLLGRLARRFAVDEQRIRERLRQLRRAGGGRATPAGGGPARGGANPAEPNRSDLAAVPARPGQAQPARLESERAESDRAESDRPARQRLLPQELELLGILARHPELVEDAVASISSERLTTDDAIQLFGVYAARLDGGESVAFEEVLLSIENPYWKYLLVAADEDARDKSEPALESAAERLDGLVRHFQLAAEAQRQRETVHALHAGGLDEEEELLALMRIVQSERNRQGISAPTEG